MTLTNLQPAGWPRPKGYANGMMGEGRHVLVAGQIGWDTAGAFPEGFVAQVDQALANVVAVVEAAGGGVADIARMTWYVTDIALYRTHAAELGPVWRARLGKHFPAMAVIGCAGLVEPAALVEITAEAILPPG
jgi:enamine deaminase RidA (YjgF/YER057c/UK114 family)